MGVIIASLPALVFADEVETTLTSAGTYTQKIALLGFVILLTVSGVRVAIDPNHKAGMSALVGCLIGIAVTALAPRIVAIVQGWTGLSVAGF